MLFVLNKEKIISYMIAFSTVAILLCISVVNINKQEVVETSSNKITQNNVIYGE